MPKQKKPERSAVVSLEQVIGPELWRRLTDLAGEEKSALALVVEAVGEYVERRSQRQPRAKTGSAAEAPLPPIVKTRHRRGFSGEIKEED